MLYIVISAGTSVESLRLWKRQHLADFFSWGTKHGIRDETKGPTKKGLGTIIKRKDIEPA